jgi:hypothetical protein
VPVKEVYLYPLRREERRPRAGAPAVAGPPARAPVSAPPRRPTPQDWADEEFGAVALGDARLHERLLTLARDFYTRPQANVPQACGTRARTKAAYRFSSTRTTMNAYSRAIRRRRRSAWRASAAWRCRTPPA